MKLIKLPFKLIAYILIAIVYVLTLSKSVGESIYLCTRTVYAGPYWLLHFRDYKRIFELKA